MHPLPRRSGFTLIELLTVIAIIAILMGLLFPAIIAAKNTARKAQAKNDESQIVTAVKMFYTDYGQYPISPNGTAPTVTGSNPMIYGDPKSSNPAPDYPNNRLFNALRAVTSAVETTNENPRQVAYLNVPFAKSTTTPKGGIGTADGIYYDPWGKPYSVAIDKEYQGFIIVPYTNTATTPQNTLMTGVAVWSYGPDTQFGAAGDSSGANSKFDDVLSWQ